MQVMKQVLLNIYRVWAAFVFFVFLIIFFPFFIIPLLINQRLGFITCSFLKLWAYIFSKLTSIEYRIYGKENIKRGASYIYTCNHTSLLDSPGIALTVPDQWRPLGKKELLKVPVFGVMLKYLAVIVDRSNPRSRQESVKKMMGFLNKGISVLIFPEGTMNRTDKVLQPFYDGAFRMAIETQQEILPMVIINAGNLFPPHSMNIKPGLITVRVGKPVSSKGMTFKDLPALKEEVFNKMHTLIQQGQADD